MRKIFVTSHEMDFVVNELPYYPKWFAQWVNVKTLDDLNGVQIGEYVMLTDSIRVETVRVHGICALPVHSLGEILPMVAVRL